MTPARAGSTIAEFAAALSRAIAIAIERAQRDVREPLPQVLLYQLEFRDRSDHAAALDEVLQALFVGGRFPRIVDVAIRGVARDATVVWLRPSGHSFVANFAETWNDPPGLGPFKPVGLLLPAHFFERARPYSLADLREAITGREEARGFPG